MSIHSTFAENLRSKCMEHESIAAVCSGIGINRQQFNKYLAGSALPNAITLRKICKYLDVPEQALFLGDPSPVPRSKERVQFNGLPSEPFSLLGGLCSTNLNEETELCPGAYYCYFPLQNAPGLLLRSLVLVRKRQGVTTFVRFTVFPSSNRSAKYLAAGKHRGIVFSNGKDFYFLGMNIYAPRQLSLMTVELTKDRGSEFFSGAILTRNANDVVSSQLCMRYESQEKTVRQMVRELGFHHELNCDLEPLLLAKLHTPVLSA
jgi:transcriptional regulator with XRE-family HTH domain